MKPLTLFIYLVLAVIALVSCASPKPDWMPVNETEHFTFFSTNEAEEAVPLLAKELEAHYHRITTDL